MALKNPLPDGMGSHFTALLTHHNGQELKIDCLLIPERNESTKFRVRFLMDVSSEHVLRTWLLGTEEESE